MVDLTVFTIKGNWVSQKKAPSVPVVTNSLRDPGKPGNQRGVKSILQEYGHRKFPLLKQPGEPEFPYGATEFLIISYYLVDIRIVFKNRYYRRLDKQAYCGAWVCLS